MPHYRLIDTATGETVLFRQMDHEAAHALNAELDGQMWIRGLDRSGSTEPQSKSLVSILRDLDTEGFTEHSAHIVRKWIRQRSRDMAHRVSDHEELKRQFGKFMRPQTPEDRRAVSRYLTRQTGDAFGAGINVGLSVSALESLSVVLARPSAKLRLADTQVCEHCGKTISEFRVCVDGEDMWVACQPCLIEREMLTDAGDDS